MCRNSRLSKKATKWALIWCMSFAFIPWEMFITLLASQQKKIMHELGKGNPPVDFIRFTSIGPIIKPTTAPNSSSQFHVLSRPNMLQRDMLKDLESKTCYHPSHNIIKATRVPDI